ncbi:MAG: MFS transporter [Pseudomonadota bacterium]|jgi:MFS family permease|nr:MFS transporter [Porticoccaceae bacterium]MCH2559992.1 MFS transporter [Pseudomonadales bacterium]MEC7158074.1 MFS transporter [Pseudomonadota bacterium]MAL68506.1 MFS transporter [Porticoccaceae bacterium]MBE64020.1 MFS transporter [Porticoccaceae bacterium]|tara:strand:+ start:2001 stop:3323 length:1323 start_codon:yes stop_codon:yes gene_type:complete
MKQNNKNNSYRTMVLILLTVVYSFNFIDRQIVGILAPFIQQDLNLTNTQLGLLTGFYFALFYTFVAIPIAWLADRFNRVNIVSIALATWSGFTALFGLAGNYLQISLARMGVGIGEAGGSPPSHSIISDLYSKEERASALGVYSMGIPFGVMAAYLVTASLIGSSSDAVDWRRIFVILGLAGIALALVVRLVIREPQRGSMEMEQVAKVKQPPFLESLKTLLSIPSWWGMCFGIAFGSFVAYAFAAFQTKYLLLLDPTYDFKLLLIILGIMNGTTYAGGTFIGARIADRWGAKNIKAYGWLPAIAVILTFPLGVLCFWVPSVNLHLILVTALLFFSGIYFGPCFAIAQTLAPINQRAMSTALFFFILNMIALGGGPTFAGWLIDFFKTDASELHATRLAMTFTYLVLIPSIVSFVLVSKILPRDWRNAEERNAKLSQSHG